MNFRQILGIAIATLIVLGFAGLGIANAVTTHSALETKKVELQSTQDKIKLLQLQYGQLEIKLQSATESQTTSQEQIDQLQKEKDDLDNQLKAARAQVQAKAVVKQNTVYAADVSKEQLMASAGISNGDYFYADSIITKESGWRECVRNGGAVDCTYNGELAYGLCQSLPGRKMASAGADWQSNSVTQLKWCNSYAVNRYGSWYNAYVFWQNNKWW